MTAQVTDKIILEGESYSLASEPLGNCWDARGHPRPPFVMPHTGCWRGYVATWRILEGRLFLIDLDGTIASPGEESGARNPWNPGTQVGLKDIFPGEEPPILADWFTGTLHVREGEMLRFIHMGYESIYAQSRYIEVVGGRVTDTLIVDNRTGGDTSARDWLRRAIRWWRPAK